MINKHFAMLIGLAFISTGLSTAIFADKLTEVSALANEKQNEKLPLHEQLLAQIRKQSDVITQPLAKIYPTKSAYNPEAVIPPQCYTKTEGQYNPCYVCHQDPILQRENHMDDGGLQQEYSFSDVGTKNHWHNLYEDRSEQVAAISDTEIDTWINQDNYSNLAPRLKEAGFRGWIPDLKGLELGVAAFDDQGFAKDGSDWVAFNYKPFPSTFWPTNGATDDVMMRLGEKFRVDEMGEYSREVYKANLAIVEANVKGFSSISSLPVDEEKVGVDLNEDGELTIIDYITKVDKFVGGATDAFIDTYLYPSGTEFMHTVRYVAFNEAGEVVPSKRMKEVRYTKKWKDSVKETYHRGYFLERLAKERGELPKYILIGDWGLDNGYAWSVQGFIEGHDGELRTLSYDENLFCMGCHAAVGSTIDKTFSFPRKVDGAKGWGYIDLRGMPDAPNMGEEKGEILTYLERVGGGGEFRSNPEMFNKWFNHDGTVNVKAVTQAKDVHELITPSLERARELNKAYRVIVSEQDYIYGRDATVTPPQNVYDQIDNESAPTLPKELKHSWDIRLDWNATNKLEQAAIK